MMSVEFIAMALLVYAFLVAVMLAMAYMYLGAFSGSLILLAALVVKDVLQILTIGNRSMLTFLVVWTLPFLFMMLVPFSLFGRAMRIVPPFRVAPGTRRFLLRTLRARLTFLGIVGSLELGLAYCWRETLQSGHLIQFRGLPFPWLESYGPVGRIEFWHLHSLPLAVDLLLLAPLGYLVARSTLALWRPFAKQLADHARAHDRRLCPPPPEAPPPFWWRE